MQENSALLYKATGDNPTNFSLLENKIDAFFKRLSFEERVQLESVNILFAGAGNVGSNIATALIMHGIGINGNWHFYDPDQGIQERNIASGQAYFPTQIGQPKTFAISENLNDLSIKLHGKPINTTVSKARAMLPGEVSKIHNKQKIDIIIDAIDISAPESVLLLHEEAKSLGIPVFSGMDLSKGLAVDIYPYDFADLEPLNGLMSKETVHDYIRIICSNPSPIEAKYASYATLLRENLLQISDLHPSVIIDLFRNSANGNTSQDVITARVMAQLVAQNIAKYILNENPPSEFQRIRYDLEQESVFKPIYFAKRALFTHVIGRLIKHFVLGENFKLLNKLNGA